MNNNLNHWHVEQMTRYEGRERDRAAERARLLREAGLAGPSLLARLVTGLGNLLEAGRKRLQARRSIQPKALPKKSPRSA